MCNLNLDILKVDLKEHLEAELLEAPAGRFDERSLKELIEDAATNRIEFEGSPFLSGDQIAYLNDAITAFYEGDEDLNDYLER